MIKYGVQGILPRIPGRDQQGIGMGKVHSSWPSEYPAPQMDAAAPGGSAGGDLLADGGRQFRIYGNTAEQFQEEASGNTGARQTEKRLGGTQGTV
jgi:hypothetical protein